MIEIKLVEFLEEQIKFYKTDINRADFFQCLLEIVNNKTINEHKYVYAYLENLEHDYTTKTDSATVKLVLK